MIKTVFLILLVSTQVPQKTITPSTWKMVRSGMTEQQVISFLGEPVEKESSSRLSVWYYQDSPIRDGEQIIKRTKIGTVVFRAERPGQFTVSETFEPDWSKVKPASPTVLPQNQPVPVQLPKPQTVMPPSVKPVVKPIQQPSPVQPRVQSLQNTMSDSPKPQKKDPADAGSRYFIYCGGAFIVIALIIAITQGSKLFL